MDSISLWFVVPGNIYTPPIDGIAKDRKLWRGDQRKNKITEFGWKKVWIPLWWSIDIFLKYTIMIFSFTVNKFPSFTSRLSKDTIICTTYLRTVHAPLHAWLFLSPPLFACMKTVTHRYFNDQSLVETYLFHFHSDILTLKNIVYNLRT